MMNFLKKLGREVEPEDLDTGYDSGYYGGQTEERSGAATPARPVGRGYDEPEYRSGRDEQPKREGGYYEEDAYTSRGERAYTRPTVVVPENKGTLYFRPDFYSDKRDEMVDGLRGSHVVMVSVNRMDSTDRMRLVDYLMGAVHALNGEVAYRNGILAMTPKGVELDESDYELLEEEEAEMVEEEFEEATEWDEDSDVEYAEEGDSDEEYAYSDYEDEEA